MCAQSVVAVQSRAMSCCAVEASQLFLLGRPGQLSQDPGKLVQWCASDPSPLNRWAAGQQILEPSQHDGRNSPAFAVVLGLTRHAPALTFSPQQLGNMTLLELSKYDGRDSLRPLLLAVKGRVFDVTTGRAFYGPGARCNWSRSCTDWSRTCALCTAAVQCSTTSCCKIRCALVVHGSLQAVRCCHWMR